MPALMNSHFPIAKVQTIIRGYLNPNDQNLFNLKSALNLPQPTENLRVALTSPQSNIYKKWLTEIFLCCIRYIYNREEIMSGQIRSEQMETLKDEEIALLLLEEKKSEERDKTIRASLKVPLILLDEAAKLKNETCFQTLQLAKATELEFYRNIVTDDVQFAKVLTAIEAKHCLLAAGEKLLRKLEKELENPNLSPKERQQKEDQIQAYKDYLRLSSTENLQKFAPELLQTPEKATLVAQQSAVNSEVMVNLLQGGMLTLKSPQPGFFYDDHFGKLYGNLDILFNKEIESNNNSSLLNNTNLYTLLRSLNQVKQEPRNQDIINTIYLEMQNTIVTLNRESSPSPILNCLERWQRAYFPKPQPIANQEEEEEEEEEEKSNSSRRVCVSR
jgi:hypothetical protein